MMPDEIERIQGDTLESATLEVASDPIWQMIEDPQAELGTSCRRRGRRNARGVAYLAAVSAFFRNS